MDGYTTLNPQDRYQLIRETLWIAIACVLPSYAVLQFVWSFPLYAGTAVLLSGVVYFLLLHSLEESNPFPVTICVLFLFWLYITLGMLLFGVWNHWILVVSFVFLPVAAYVLIGTRFAVAFLFGHSLILTAEMWLRLEERPFNLLGTFFPYTQQRDVDLLYFSIFFMLLFMILRSSMLAARFARESAIQLAAANQKLQLNEQYLQQEVEKRTRELTESEEKNRALAEALPDVVSRASVDGVYLDFRVPPDYPNGDQIESDRVGRSFFDFVSPELANEFLKKIREVVRTGKRITHEYVTPTSGAIIEGRITKVNDNETIAILRDVTKQRQAETELKESERRYRALVSAMPDILIRMNREGVYLDYWKPQDFIAPLNITGERIGHNISEFLPTNIVKQMMHHITLALDSGQIQIFEYERIEPKRRYEARIFPYSDDAITAVVRDITHQHNELKRLQAVINATPSIVIVFEHGTPNHVRWANELACRYLNILLDEIVGMDIGHLIRVKEKAVLAAILDKLRNNQPIKHLETELGMAENTFAWFRITVSSVMYDGKMMRMAVLEDIDELRRTTAVFQRVQKLDSLGVFAGGIAHDFNNLLTSIITQTSIAQRKFENDQDGLPHLGKALLASEKATSLTQKMLAFSGKGQFKTELINLNTIVLENMTLLEAVLPKQSAFQFKAASKPLYINGDKVQIQQVLMNLILNAAQATTQNEDGKISLRVVECWMDEGVVAEGSTAVFFQPAHYASIIVTDNGSGMSPETKRKLFEPFFTTKSTGHGLGLAAVVGIMRGHSGEIIVESEQGVGSTFQLIFPKVQPEPESTLSEASTPPTLPASPSHHVLVIDDEIDILEAFKDSLALAQIPVMVAQGGNSGLALFTEHQEKIGLVILDLLMPDKNGAEVLHQLQQQAPNLPVILTSGYSDQIVMGELLSDGVVEFLKKPFTTKRLLTMVERLMHKNPNT